MFKKIITQKKREGSITLSWKTLRFFYYPSLKYILLESAIQKDPHDEVLYKNDEKKTQGHWFHCYV